MHKQINYILKPYQLRLSPESPAPLDLFDRQGRLVLTKGQVISLEIGKLLKEQALYVLQGEWKQKQKSLSTLPSHPDQKAQWPAHMQWLYRDARLVNKERLDQASDVVGKLQGHIRDHPKLRLYFGMLEQHDHYTYMHSINVALLGTLLGLELNYTPQQLQDLALGALLHDVGKMLIPQDILNKPGQLSQEEYALMKRHPLMGTSIMGEMVDNEEQLTAMLQHHERWQGQGYPQGLVGEDIHPYAQIVAVADVFDALTSHRPYRPAFPPYHAVELIMKGEGSEFSPKVVRALLRTVVLYPANTMVLLNTGEVGQVVGVPTHAPTRPRVRVLYTACGSASKCDRVIDLQQNTACLVSTVKYGGNQMKFMLIDDDRACLEGLVSALEPTGHDFYIFTVPEDAVAAYQKQPCDVVITDMKMPGMNGIEVLKAIRAIDPEAKVIVITGHGDVDTAIAAVNNGAYAFFGKPVDIGELLETLEKLAEEQEVCIRTKEEQQRMVQEYNRLKKAYEELQQLLKRNGQPGGEERSR